MADLGASNGYFSFEARRRGANVVAFDFRHKDNSGFGLLQRINGMHDIEHHHVNVLDIDPGRYGRFDVVLALGLLYHVADPYLALTRCADLCLTHLLIESYCIDPHLPAETAGEPLMRFIADPARFPEYGSLNDDRSNFWGFTSECLRRMVADVGFTVERSQLRGERLLIDCRRSPSTSDTATRRGWTYGVRPRVPVDGDPDEPDAWTIF